MAQIIESALVRRVLLNELKRARISATSTAFHQRLREKWAREREKRRQERRKAQL